MLVSQDQFNSEPIPLVCSAMNYPWGKIGSKSLVAKLLPEEIDETKPYAELWIGFHPSAPSKPKHSSINPEDYPFLMKVLSVNEPLSIQMHPDKRTAEELHKADPSHYPDSNHKPEIGIALTTVRLFHGFKADFSDTLNRYPELLALVAGRSDREGMIKQVIRHENRAPAVRILLDRLKAQGITTELEEIFIESCTRYSADDVGLPLMFFLNLVTLKPGEAIYTPANVPHGYISGELIECMANSDNVIRCGLTPKFIDSENFLRFLDMDAKGIYTTRDKEDSCVYDCPEFNVAMLTGDSRVTIDSTSLGIVTSGNGMLGCHALREGDALVIPKGTFQTSGDMTLFIGAEKLSVESRI